MSTMLFGRYLLAEIKQLNSTLLSYHTVNLIIFTIKATGKTEVQVLEEGLQQVQWDTLANDSCVSGSQIQVLANSDSLKQVGKKYEKKKRKKIEKKKKKEKKKRER